MSANLELVRSIYADWERGDYSRADWAHSEIEFVLADGPDPGHWIGVAGTTAAWRNRLTFAHDVRTLADEYRELDDERVLVIFHHTGRDKVSGFELGHTRGGANVFHVRDGQVTRLVVFLDPDRALADAGCTPESGAPGPD
jgi:ketosteroid isomerase-like protein